MRLSSSALSLLVPLVLAGGGSPARAEPDPSAPPLAPMSAVSRGCTFRVSIQPMPGFPPQYEVIVTRAASSTCPWGAGSKGVGTTYLNNPALSITASDLGVAVSFTRKATPSGSAAVSASLTHLAPDTLTVVRSASVTAINGAYAGFIYGCDLTLLPDGTTLEMRGTKFLTIPGEVGSGSHYVATFPAFFVSSTPPVIVSS